MFCPSCGEKNLDGAIECANAGRTCRSLWQHRRLILDLDRKFPVTQRALHGDVLAALQYNVLNILVSRRSGRSTELVSRTCQSSALS